MCGIAGILGRLDSFNRSALRRMSDAMVHRGPDGAGSWESSPDQRGWGALLAHRRLSILDLSPAAAEPMVDPVTGQVIVFNGELYNYKAIRARLVQEGQRFESTGDTAVLLRAVSLHGRAAMSRLRGMYAFAMWDDRERQLLVARDPLGIKPLYLARTRDPAAGWKLAFASELRALLASGLLGRPRLDGQAVASVTWNGFVVGPGTAVQGVELAWPGRTLVFDGGGEELVSEDHWSIPPIPPDAKADEVRLGAVLEEGVGLHLASDVPLAVFLSGGIDSSAIANLAQRAAGTPVHTFTLAFEEEEFNEGPIARRIAEAIGTRHREVVISEQDFVGHLDAALDSLDQPTFDGLNSYYLSRAIREAGFTVALAGTGGDELFGGYTSYRDLPVLYRWLRRTRAIPVSVLGTLAGVGSALLAPSRAPVPPQTRWAKLPAMVRTGGDLLAMYQIAYSLFLPAFRRDLLRPEVREDLWHGLPQAMYSRLRSETRERSPLSAIAVAEQRLFLGERLLRDNDVASMASSLEQRVPFVDHLLFETVDRLPDKLRFSPVGRKEILRRVGLRGLDPGLFERPKVGFVLPFDRWLRRGLRTAVDETLLDAAAVEASGLNAPAVRRLWEGFLGGAPGLYWSRIWALYVLVRWCQRNGVAL